MPRPRTYIARFSGIFYKRGLKKKERKTLWREKVIFLLSFFVGDLGVAKSVDKVVFI